MLHDIDLGVPWMVQLVRDGSRIHLLRGRCQNVLPSTQSDSAQSLSIPGLSDVKRTGLPNKLRLQPETYPQAHAACHGTPLQVNRRAQCLDRGFQQTLFRDTACLILIANG